jgi:hypothetical protein
MENQWYSGLNELLKEVGLAGRPGYRSGDRGPGPDEEPETGEDALAEELLGLGMDKLGRYVGRAVDWMKDLQGVMWGDGPRDERRQAAAEHRAIHDVSLEAARRAQSTLTDVAQGRRSVGEGLQELFETTDPLPIAQAVEEVRREREAPAQQRGSSGLPKEKPDVFSRRLPPEGAFSYDAEVFSIPQSNVAHFWSFLSRRYDTAVEMAGEFAKRFKRERVVGPEIEDDDLRNALQHFLASFTLTRDFESPSLVEKLGALNERFLSSPGALYKETPRDVHREDTIIDYHHNDLGIKWAKRYKGKEVSWDELYDLSRRLAKGGEFRYPRLNKFRRANE